MKRLGRLLTELGWITAEQLEHALQMQEVLGGRLGTNLLELDALSEERLQTALSHQLGVPAARPRDLRNVPPEVHRLVPSRLARRWRAVPFRMLGEELHVAMLSVAEPDFLDELSFATGKEIRPYVAHEARLVHALASYYLVEPPSRVEQLVARLDRDEATQATRPGDILWTPRLRSPAPEGAPARAVAAARPKPSDDTTWAAEPPLRVVSGPEPAGGSEAFAGRYERLARLDDRDRIARAVLELLATRFRRVVLYRVARGVASGWLGSGPGVDAAALRRLRVSLCAPSVLFNLAHGAPHHCGPLPPMPSHEAMSAAWGGGLPGDCIVFGIRVGGRLVCAVLCEPGYRSAGPGARCLGIGQLHEVADAAGEAFERCVLRRRELVPGAAAPPPGSASDGRATGRRRVATTVQGTRLRIVDNAPPPG
ncbi:MAG TPA: hypothetical protein VMV46_23435 [Thermoanaerobaculia bacterium]|nr:hypothetical protein [Thermoanaerobaculia bacterium]